MAKFCGIRGQLAAYRMVHGPGVRLNSLVAGFQSIIHRSTATVQGGGGGVA